MTVSLTLPMSLAAPVAWLILFVGSVPMLMWDTISTTGTAIALAAVTEHLRLLPPNGSYA